MKRLLSSFLTLALILALAACGGSAEPDPNAGTYVAQSATMMGMTLDITDMFEGGLSIELQGGGKALFHYDGKDYRLKWSLDGDAFHASGSGAEIDGTLSGGVLQVEDLLGRGMSIRFVCPELAGKAPEAAPEAAPASAEPERYEPLLDALATLPSLDAEATMAMSNWISGYGSRLILDGRFYGSYFLAADHSAHMVAFDLVNDGSSIRAEAWQLLDETCTPNYLQARDGRLYYARYDRDAEEDLSIESIRLDGSDRRRLYDGPCCYLSLRGDRLYFTDAGYRLLSTDLDGGDLQTVLDKEVYYPYMLDEDWLLYQDDADNESLHLYHLPDRIDLKLTDRPGYAPIVSGQTLFFAVEAEGAENAFRLARIDLSRWEEVWDEGLGCHVPVFATETSEQLFGGIFFSDGSDLFPCNNWNAVSLARWMDLEDDAYLSLARSKELITADYEIESILSPDGLVQQMMFFDRQTGYGYAIPWLR